MNVLHAKNLLYLPIIKQLFFCSFLITHTRLHDDGILEIKYEILDKLGEGSFGTVFRVRNRENDLFYAMKTIGKKPGNKIKASVLENEVKLLKEVNHPNLIQLHEVLESSQNLYLIVELCEGGELGLHLKKIGPLPEEIVKQIMSKLVNALYYLHKMDIVHRDLKLENILLKNIPTSKTDEFDIRVTDFGLSSKQSITNTDSLFNEYCGTPLYMAPEILDNKNYSALCDVWALGIIMFYLITGRHPYVANNERRLLELIRTQKLRYDSEKFKNLSSEGLAFLQGMLVYDTVHRRTMGELTVHPWLTGRSDKGATKDIITMMREFQAENERKELNTENNPSTCEENDEEIDRSTDVSPHQIKLNTSEKKPTYEKQKFQLKTNRYSSDLIKTPRRSTHESDVLSSTNPKSSDSSTDWNENHQTRIRSNPIGFDRSQSHNDLISSPKLSRQRLPSNNSLGLATSSSPSNSTPRSSAVNTLKMIKKPHSNNSTSSLPTISNHHANKLS
ncbi:unnamed protein product [Adineta ricciae]|uniref:Protein kinase domain-containing protein n=1 Tax=Adineta ricciae TaxID=249248 RepID=A0A814H8I2_ADIRI|nr:unnamed protein product [Adineta ricciae]